MSLRDELIQVAAVAIAIVTDNEQGSTRITDPTAVPSRFSIAHQVVMAEVLDERMRQEKKWGAQHHPIAEWLVILGEEYGEACQAALEEVMYPKEDT